MLERENIKNKMGQRIPIGDSIKLCRVTFGKDGEVKGSGRTEEFIIKEVLSAGGSCVAYKAIVFNGDVPVLGTLKELYPLCDKHGRSVLKRRSISEENLANQLYVPDGEDGSEILSAFKADRDTFLEAYKQALRLKAKNPLYDNFLSTNEFYKSITGDGDADNYTCYIWTPGDNTVVSFAEHLSKMQKDIFERIESSNGNVSLFLAEELRTVLQAIKAFAVGIQALHQCDQIVHLDIKPQNFGIRTLGKNDGNNVSVELFDVDSFYPLRNPPEAVNATAAFSAPEVVGDYSYRFLDKIGPWSDIYSLGAILYNAIVIFSQTERGCYSYTKFPEKENERRGYISDFMAIPATLSQSALIKYSEYNSKSDFIDIIIAILRRSLARHSVDYDYARNYTRGEGYIDAFISDLEEADNILSNQISKAKQYGEGKHIEVIATDKDEYYADDAEGCMQNLLYSRPLYNYLSGKEDKKQAKVLVLGGGTYSQKFLDIAFELSQTREFNINVTVISKDAKLDERRYLDARPEFKKYFAVNGVTPASNVYYGTLRFVQTDGEVFGTEAGKDNAEVVRRALGKDSTLYSYVFISLVEESLNKKVAEDLKASGIIGPALFGDRGIVNYVCYKDVKAADTSKETEEARKIELNPVFIGNTIAKNKDYSFLKRMAFNCHLLWTGINVDIRKTKSKFRSAYESRSSFASILSIKYKLHSIGIDFDELSGKKGDALAKKLAEITERYKKTVGLVSDGDREETALLNELTMYEHRRWLVNIICSSYTLFPCEEYGALKDSNKDKKKRRHTCIVPGGSEWALNSGKWLDLGFWDSEKLEETPEFARLDELDKVSVRLHRHFNSLINGNVMLDIEEKAERIRQRVSDKKILAAFDTLMVSMRMISSMRISRNSTLHENYRHCLSKFERMLTDDLDNVEDIKKILKEIVAAFAPVKLAKEYTDYKSNDQRIIRGIPFIMNYTTALRICIPFIDGDENNKWFANVASSMVLNPSIVTYFMEARSFDEIIPRYKDKLTSISRVMDGHSLQTDIRLVIFVNKGGKTLDDEKRNEITGVLCDISERIYHVDIVEVEEDEDETDFFIKLKTVFENDKKSANSFCAVEKNDSGISRMISFIFGSSPKCKYPGFTFDSDKHSFAVGKNSYACSYFDDIPFKAHINIEDMFVNRLDVYSEPELYLDYKKLWDECYFDADPHIREKKVAGWKKLTSMLKKKSEAIDQVQAIYYGNLAGATDVETTLYAPAFCKDSLEMIFDKFKSAKLKLISRDSTISLHNSTTLKLHFKSSYFIKNTIANLLSKNLYLLSDSSILEIIVTDTHVFIEFNTLSVYDFTVFAPDNADNDKGQVNSQNRVVDNKALVKTSDRYQRKKEEEMEYAERFFEYLFSKGYLIGMAKSSEKVPSVFCYASPKIKDLLTNEGRLLEIYTYYETLETGYFDEVRTSLCVKRISHAADNEYTTTHEFDMIAVKGFSTQIVEIKARTCLDQDFYSKLKANGDNFGINKQLVLVADISEDGSELIARGKDDYRVETVSGADNICHVGERLRDLMENKK